MRQISVRKLLALLLSVVLPLAGCARPEVEAALETMPLMPQNAYAGAYFFDVGQGNCSFILCPNGDRVMYDCGSLADLEVQAAKNAKAIIKNALGNNPYLRTLIVSHPDRDHYNQIRDMLPQNVQIDTALFGGQESQYSSDAAQQLLGWVKKRTNRVLFPLQNEHSQPGVPEKILGCSGNYTKDGLYIMTVNADPSKTERNDKSAVVRFEAAGMRVMLTGDASAVSQEQIDDNYSKSPQFMEADLLIASHHGSVNETLYEPWVQNTNPQILLFSAGQRSNWGHPRCAVAKTFEDIMGSRMSQQSVHWFECYDAAYVPKAEWTTIAKYNTHTTGGMRLIIEPNGNWSYKSVKDNNFTNIGAE